MAKKFESRQRTCAVLVEKLAVDFEAEERAGDLAAAREGAETEGEGLEAAEREEEVAEPDFREEGRPAQDFRAEIWVAETAPAAWAAEAEEGAREAALTEALEPREWRFPGKSASPKRPFSSNIGSGCSRWRGCPS